jgi:hypothetical protein
MNSYIWISLVFIFSSFDLIGAEKPAAASYNYHEHACDKMVVLKNGTVRSAVNVAQTVAQLSTLYSDHEKEFLELVAKCRNFRIIFSEAGVRNLLKDFGFIDSHGNPLSIVKDIVLSCISGEGGEVIIVNPVKDS